MLFASQREIVQRDTLRTFALCRKAAGVGAGSAIADTIPTSSSGANATISGAREQYKHFRGQVYASIRPVIQRMAAQRPYLARLPRRRSSGKRGNFPAPMGGVKIPSWVVKAAGPAAGDLQLIDQHPALDAYHKPNPLFFDWTLTYVVAASLELTGWAYLWFPMRKGAKQIWHLPTHWVTPKHEGGVFTGWTVKPDGGAAKELPANEIAPVWYPDPSDPLAALSPTEANGLAIVIDEYIRTAQRNAFDLGIHPRMAVVLGEIGSKLSAPRRPRARKQQRQQIRAALNSRLRGVGRYGDHVILDQLISDIRPISTNVAEMDFGNSAPHAEDRVSRGFGTNRTVMGDNSGVNYASAAVAEQNVCDNAINPKLTLLGRAYTVGLVPQFDDSGDLVMFFEECHANDRTQALAEWGKGLDNGTVTLDDYNVHVLGMESRPELKIYLRPLGKLEIPAGYTERELADEDAENDSDEPDDGDEQDGEQDKPDDGNKPDKPDADKPDSGGNADDGADEADDGGAVPDDGKAFGLTAKEAAVVQTYQGYLTAWEKAHGKREGTLTKDLRQFFKEQGAAVAASIASASASGSPAAIARAALPKKLWGRKIRDAAERGVLEASLVGAMLELHTFGVVDDSPKLPPEAPPAARSKSAKRPRPALAKADDDPPDVGVDIPPEILEACQEFVAQSMAREHWDKINDATRDKLTARIQAGIEAGDTMKDIAESIRTEVFADTGMMPARAENIARTEVTGAMNAGQHEAREELADEGLIEGKEWFATIDKRTREEHAEMDGQVVDDNSEPFTFPGGEEAMYPGDDSLPPELRCNCRCTAVAVTAFTERALRSARRKGVVIGVSGPPCN